MMRIVGHGGFIEFSFVSVNLHPSWPSMELAVVVESWGFKGSDDSVHFSLENLNNFLVDLTTLERVRQGEARLLHPSDLPGNDLYEFRFRIYSTTPTGQMAIDTEILKIKYGYTDIFTNKVQTTFDIDPSILPDVLSDFKALIATRKA